MEKLTSILMPFDFSKSARKALDYTVNLIDGHKIKINLLQMSEEADMASMQKAYEDLNKKYASQLKIPMRWILGKGSLTEAILEARAEKKTEMIVMGTSGVPKGLELTHTAELVAESNCPVLVVPESTEREALSNICLVLGREEIDDPKSLYTLLEIARLFNAKVHVLTIKNTEETVGYSKTDEKNESTLMYYLENFYSEHTYIENTDIVEGIFSYASGHEIDVIALLPRIHVKHGKPTQGLLTKELVTHSKIPVLTL